MIEGCHDMAFVFKEELLRKSKSFLNVRRLTFLNFPIIY